MASEMREGDWVCTSCNNHNFASRQSCNRCHGPKAPPPGDNVRPGDWLCPSCGNHNYARKVNCNRCQAPKPGGMGGPSFGGPSFGGPTPVYAHAPAMPPMPPAAGNFKDGDWMCPECGNHNYASRSSCNKCQAPKAESSPPPPRGYGPSRGIAPSRAAPYQPPMAPPPSSSGGNMRAGDWVCSSCGNHNYASRTTCNKCGGPNLVADGGASFAGRGPPRPLTAMRMMGPPMASSRGPGGNFKDGDWMCASCGNHNFASRESCNKCGKPKNTPSGFREGDWICSSCSNHNFASRTSCNKCGAAQ